MSADTSGQCLGRCVNFKPIFCPALQPHPLKLSSYFRHFTKHLVCVVAGVRFLLPAARHRRQQQHTACTAGTHATAAPTASAHITHSTQRTCAAPADRSAELASRRNGASRAAGCWPAGRARRITQHAAVVRGARHANWASSGTAASASRSSQPCASIRVAAALPLSHRAFPPPSRRLGV